MAGGALLVAGVFLPWYGTDSSNPHSQARGEMTVLTSIAAFGPIADNGFVDRPGDIAVPLRLGLLAALAATVIMVGAAAQRSSESERPRKPPGTI